ncbi:MAG: tripartite tricarboxylate transporter substrate binding protein [Rhodoferax sp.]|nr:tripartite tricarboxylate transporter substrate binding protein [Rhodoferax sp.]
MQPFFRRAFLSIGLTAALVASAQTANPITLLEPFPPGGATDQLARVVAQKLTEQQGLVVNVDNRPGGGSQIAVNVLRQAPADGSTLFMGDIGAFSLNRHLYRKLSYNVDADLQPISLVGKAPLFVMVPKGSPFQSLGDLIAAGRNGELSYGSPGVGTGAHVAAEMLRARTGIKLNHVPYRGAAPALVDLAGGQLAFVFDPLASSGPLLKDGRIRPLAVATPQRSKLMPDLPTVAEGGAPGVNFVAWFGIAAKAGTPPDVVQRLNRQIGEAISSPDVVKRFADIGIEIAPSSVEGFGQLIKADALAYEPVIKALDINLD